jgi:hypothetical protein
VEPLLGLFRGLENLTSENPIRAGCRITYPPGNSLDSLTNTLTGLSGLPLAVHTAGALALPAADGLDNLLAVVAYRAEEHPPRKAVEAVALLVSLVLLVGRGGLRALR